MRTPNTKCCICGKPMYRRPRDIKETRFVSCRPCYGDAIKRYGLTGKQKQALKSGRKKGTNHLEGMPKTKESNRRRGKSISLYYKKNPQALTERGKKIRGDKHYKWNGGSSRLNISIRQMTEHRKWMDAVKDRDGKCVICESTIDLESHHKKPMAKIIAENNIRSRKDARGCSELWDTGNGITLCRKCHYEIHGRKLNANRRKNVQENAA